MATELLPGAVEESSYVVSASFFDATTTAVTPTSIAWTLSNDTGMVLRSTTIAVPSTTVNIVLSGTDLYVEGDYDRTRFLTIKAVYNSTYGLALTLKHEVKFQIKNLLNESTS
jgi:hypothetical protein